jgi:hypothetical protein
LKLENTGTGGTNGINVTKNAYYNAWSPTNPDGTMPRLNYYNGNFTDRVVEDGSYLRLGMVTLGYRLPVSKVNFLSAVDVFVTGRNLLTITNYTGFDPEVNSFANETQRRGVDWSSYPNTRSVVFGLNVTF